MVNNNMSLISIGMPVYNGEQYIEAALDSILSQSFRDFELLISDNASIDRTEEICRLYSFKDHRIRYFRNDKNLGAAINFNRVFKLSSGKYFMWAAHDDMYAPEFLAKCVQFLDHNPSVVLCFSKTKFIDEQGNFLKDYDYSCDVGSKSACKRFFHLVIGNYVVIEIFGVIRSNILKRTPLIGDYVASDRVLLGELALYGPFYEIPEYLFYHREHSQRSAKVYPDFHSYITWWAPSRANQILFPTWKLFFEQLMVIKRSPLNRADKIKCYLQMVKWLRAQRYKMMNDIIFNYKLIKKYKQTFDVQ